MPTEQPNVVLIVADDLDARSFGAMPYVSDLVRRQGMTFSRFYVTTPICGPSRASLLRGQYAHNHGMLRNNGDRGGFHTFHLEGREESTIATWLRDAGYRTGLVGKYLNGYPRLPRRLTDQVLPETYVPPGWDEWYAQMDRGALGGQAFRLNENGRIVGYPEQPENYTTDVLGRHAIRFVERAAAEDAPFFLYIATLVPHYPAIPAPRHAGAFRDARLPRPPSFDAPNVSGKPAYVRATPRLSDEQVDALEEHYRDRLRSLLSLDEMVAGLVRALDAAGELERTVLLVTSDHGWHQGEHRIPLGKETPYEESIHAPLGVIGPGILGGRVIDDLALNIDLAPTIADLAGAAAPQFVDGRSLEPLLRGETPAAWRRSFLVEHRGIDKSRVYPGIGEALPVPDYQALRCGPGSGNLLYVEYQTGERELYDLATDPHELDNLAAATPETAIAQLSARLGNLRRCSGVGCRAAEDAPIDVPASDPLSGGQSVP